MDHAIMWMLTGLIAGFLDYTFAVGFGLIASLILVLSTGADPRTVAGTAALAQVLLALVATGYHNRSGNIDPSVRSRARLLSLFAAATIAGGLATSIAVAGVKRHYIELIYPFSLILLALFIIYDGVSNNREGWHGGPNGRLLVIGTGLLSGAYKALIGGGYSVLVVLLQKRIGVDLRSGIALAPLLKAPSFLLIGVTYLLAGFVQLENLAALTIGALASLPLSAATLGRLGHSRNIELVTAAILLAAGLLKLALQSTIITQP
ncbi:MAG: sulfite exporter TauE/SafE family protein [Desulfurococcales archaeon]|nr:sulfite exporter TauE/SafE family protein [Desulfurococcales archaeon]